MPNTTYDDDKLLHSGRKGMKWGMHIFGRSRASAFSSRRRRRREGGLSEHERELAVLNLYRNRDRVSTKVLKDKVSRIETEQKLKKLAEAPAIARAEAKKKRQQARLQFAAKVASAGLDVYSKWPNQSVAKKFDPKKQANELKKALEDFEYRKGMAKAFKDVPLTLTKFDDKVGVDTSKLFQSVNVAGVDVYIPETIQNRFMIQHSGRKGMKWGHHIFGDPNRRAFNKAVRGTRSIVRKMDKQVRKKGMAGSDHLAESESIESLMTKRGPYKLNYSSSKHLVAKQSVANIIRNNKLLATRKGNFNGDDVNAVVGAADHLKYGEGKVKKLTSRAGDSKRSLVKENRRLAKESLANAKALLKGDIDANQYRNNVNDITERAKPVATLLAYKQFNKNGNPSSETMSNIGEVYDRGVTSTMRDILPKKNKFQHSAVGGEVNGVYIPSNEEVLLQYGRKGMKWKKRKNPLAEAGDHLAEDLVYAVDKKVIDKHVEDAARDKKTVERNMADNISKIKSGVRNGKTIDPSEQKYHDAYMRNAQAYGRVSKVLEARQKHAKEVAAAHAKDVKNRRKK